MTTTLPSKPVCFAFCCFEALRRMGWPSANIFVVAAIEGRSMRPCVMVTLQDDEKSTPMLALVVSYDDQHPGTIDEFRVNTPRWNDPVDVPFRQNIWDNRAAHGFDEWRFMSVLVAKGLNIGPERAS